MAISNNGRIRVNVTGARGAIGIDLQGTIAPGQFLVKAPGGERSFTTASGTGTDSALRSDLAQTNGAQNVGYNGSTVKSALDAVAPAAAIADNLIDVRSAEVSRNNFDAPNSVDFANLYRPNEKPVSEIRIAGTATADIGSNSELEVISQYDAPTKSVVVPQVTFAEGRATFQVRRGSDSASSAFMIRWQAPNGDTRAIWSGDGSALSYGLIGADGSVTLLGTNASAFVGGAGQLVWVELETPPLFSGLTWRVRAWVDGGTRPSDANALSGVYGAEVANRRLNEGRLMVSSIGTVPTRLARAVSVDGTNGTKISSQVAFVGRWFSRFDGGKTVMATSRGGSKFRFQSTGTNDINISYVATPSGNPVVLDVFVNGARYGSPVTLDGAAGSYSTKSLLTGLSPDAVSQVEVRVRGVDVFSNMWFRGAACLIEQLTPTIPSGKIAPWADTRPKILFIGDSITAGSVARGTSAAPIDYGGDVSWPVLSSDMAGFQPVVSGFGGTGLTVPMDTGGGGTSPAATEHGFNYMAGRKIDTAAENVKMIVVNLGTNDQSRSVSTASFQAAYVNFLQSLLRAYPGVGKIMAMYPFNQAYAAQIFTAVGLLNDPRIITVDTSGPSWSGITYTDGLHPNVAGHQTIANVFAPVLRNAFASASI